MAYNIFLILKVISELLVVTDLLAISIEPYIEHNRSLL